MGRSRLFFSVIGLEFHWILIPISQRDTVGKFCGRIVSIELGFIRAVVHLIQVVSVHDKLLLLLYFYMSN